MQKGEKTMLEKEFQNKILKKLRKKGLFYKIWGGGYQEAGIPDILGCYKGYFIGIELKTDKGRLSELQKYQLKRIEDNNGFSLVLRPSNEQDIWNLLEKIDNLSEDKNYRVDFNGEGYIEYRSEK